MRPHHDPIPSGHLHLDSGGPACLPVACEGPAIGRRERGELVEEAAAPDDREHAWNRFRRILRDAGLIPGEDERCSE